MTQYSFPWTCTPTGDGGPYSYSMEVVEAMHRVFGNVSPTDSGVLWWKDTAVFDAWFTNPVGGTPDTDFFLTVYNAGGSQMRVKPGVAVVQGWTFINDDEVAFSVAGGNANAVDIIGLQMSLVGQTVRLFHGQGAAASTYALVQTATTWEIPLAEIQLDGSGNYSSHTDVRKFVQTPLFSAQADSIFYHTTRGWLGPDTSTGVAATYNATNPSDNQIAYIPSRGFNAGIRMPDTSNVYAYQHIQIPESTIGDQINFEFLLFDRSAGAGQIYGRLGYTRESDPGNPVQGAYSLLPAWGGAYTQLVNWYTLYATTVTVTPGETVMFWFNRAANTVNDTFNATSLVSVGVRLIRNRAQAPLWNTELPMQ